MNTAAAPSLAESRSLRIRYDKQSTAMTPIAACNPNGGNLNDLDVGIMRDGACVAIVTLATTGVVPSEGVTDIGDTLHVDIAGAPLHASATA